VQAKSTSIDVAQLLVKLKQEGVEGIILDLRRNGGGSLEESIDLTGLFVKEGPVVQVRDFNGRTIVDEDPSPEILYDGPLVVLTSRFSASASEIVAGALQDYGRAVIVGDSATHGKGTVQSLVELDPMIDRVLPDSTNNPGALKMTVRKFYRVSGHSTQLKGVEPDIVLPSVNNYAEVGEEHLDNPLGWDEIDPASFVLDGRVRSMIPELRRRSETRIAADRDFQYVREDIDLFRKHLADKTVSLNEEERRREKKDNERRVEVRKEERSSRPKPSETVYEITLKQANLPGLPPPVSATNEMASAEAAGLHEVSAEADEAEAQAEGVADVALKEGKRVLVDLIELSGPRTELVGSGVQTSSR
jgi:carboxyl-terminal processing protease